MASEKHLVYMSYFLLLASQKFIATLIPLDMVYFDIILGMAWLIRYLDIVDYFKKKVTILIEDGIKVEFLGEYDIITLSIV